MFNNIIFFLDDEEELDELKDEFPELENYLDYQDSLDSESRE